MQESTLKKGEIQYQERIDEIRLLKNAYQDLRRELNLKKDGSGDEGRISKELMHTEKSLVKEKVKVKALSEELENPLNVHRWRKLEGSDPTAFELIQKIELLQKRLIKKSEQVCDLLASEKTIVLFLLTSVSAQPTSDGGRTSTRPPLSLYQSHHGNDWWSQQVAHFVCVFSWK